MDVIDFVLSKLFLTTWENIKSFANIFHLFASCFPSGFFFNLANILYYD